VLQPRYRCFNMRNSSESDAWPWPVLLHLVWVIVFIMLSTASSAASDPYTPRAGFVTLQFDDSHDYHYTHIFPLLEEHGFKASFGYITESSGLGIEHDAWKMVEIHSAGHEIQDHTTRHDYMWATHVDTVDDDVFEWIEWTFADVATWDSLCARSLEILDSLGIQAIGWNQPGGTSKSAVVPGRPGWIWRGGENDSLYDLIATRHPYAIGWWVPLPTAHLNLRGHNCPDRYPFFNVPHVTIDGESLQEVKTDIADAAASGLWYLAASHALNLEQIALVESLMEWLDENEVEVLTCHDGWQRIAYGIPDPFANQLPHAMMASDLDGNGKPDGFMGDCTWDTGTVSPIENARCLRITDQAEFFCYGPETGDNEFSVWLKSGNGDASGVYIIWTEIGFDWENLDESLTAVRAKPDWRRIDESGHSNLLIDVEDKVDRVRFIVKVVYGDPVIISYPELRLADPVSGLSSEGHPAEPATLRILPNPVRRGLPLTVFSATPVCMYDVLGRRVCTMGPMPCDSAVSLETQDLVPGVFFLRDPSGRSCAAKIVVFE
jgi:hypothetical protein